MFHTDNPVLRLSRESKCLYGVFGHVGVGHVHSHSSFVQDDSAGFAVVASIIKDSIFADTRIKYIYGDILTGSIVVETYGGGIGKSFAKRGITPMEAALLERALDEDAIYTQKIALKVFGRMYGQGVTETPVALQGAIALAVMDTFLRIAPGHFHYTKKKFANRIDKMAGLIINVNEMPVAFLLNINGSEGGIGPNEDNEGNTAWDEKGEVMNELGMTLVPGIIIESKAYVPAYSKNIKESTFFVRAQVGIDSSLVANALVFAAEKLRVPYILSTNSLPCIPNQLKNAAADFADKVITLGMKLKEVDTSCDKVDIVAELAGLISEDAGGITYMSNSIHEIVRAPGIVPGSAAVLSLLVSEKYKDYWKIPMLEPDDILEYRRIIFTALNYLADRR